MVRQEIQLPDADHDFIKKIVASGQFENSNDAVLAGIRLLQKNLRTEQEKISELQRLLDEGESSGVSDFTFDEIWDRGQQRYLNENA